MFQSVQLSGLNIFWRQEQMENPGSTAWHKWCADQYLRLAMEEGEDMDDADG